MDNIAFRHQFDANAGLHRTCVLIYTVETDVDKC